MKHLGSIANPEFFEKQRMRFSTWDTPRFISAYHEDLEWLHLPRGLTDRVEELFAALGSRSNSSTTARPPAIDIEFRGASTRNRRPRSRISSITTSACWSRRLVRARP